MRPMYETSADLKAEGDATYVIGEAWNVTLHKLPVSYQADWAIEKDGSIVGWGEFKRRRFKWGDYQSIILSVSKVRALLSLATVCGKALFFVKCDDAFMFVEIEESCLGNVSWGGRTCKTRDAGDIEPVVMIPAEKFKAVVTL